MRLIDRTDLSARMAQGAGAAVFLTIVNVAVRSAWGEGAPPVVGALGLLAASGGAGAVAGAVYYVTESLRSRGGWRKTTANVATLLAFCAAAVGLLLLAVASGLLGE